MLRLQVVLGEGDIEIGILHYKQHIMSYIMSYLDFVCLLIESHSYFINWIDMSQKNKFALISENS